MHGGRSAAVFVIFSLLVGSPSTEAAQQYLGKFLGKLTELHHGVSGEVYAVDGRTLHIKDFTYDGQGPAAYFFAGNSRTPSNAGFRIRDENGSPDVIRRYRKEGVTITLPEGKTLNNIKWFSIWCEEFEVNFGDVKIPRNFDYPKPLKIEGLRGVHGVSSDNIVLVDAQTLLIPNLSYDGEAPDAKFWVGRGAKPSPQGIRVPDENGKELPLRRYDRKTVVLTLPGDLTVFDIGHFGIWCEAFTVDFGHVQIPPNLNIPPSLKMLGVSPQSKLNCEVLYDDLAFEVRWAVAGDSIVLQLVSKLDNGEYMSFGLSGDDSKSVMVGGDVVVAWVDKETLKGYAEDYYLDAKSQCSGPKGSCPDERIAENTDNIRLLNAAMVNGYSIVTYQRPLRPSDKLDRPIYINKTQAIIWAIGPLNQRNEVSFHSHYTKGNQFLNFGRAPKWNCPMPEGDVPSMKVQVKPQVTSQAYEKPVEVEVEAEEIPLTTSRSRTTDRRRGSNRQEIKETAIQSRPVPTPAPVHDRNAWSIPPIQCYEPEDGVFYAQMGPTGGKRGYPAITGHVGWGISWYINGLLIPEINVVRGKTYTFVVEGGIDPETPAKYHPFYITDDPVGGYEHKSPDEKKNVRIFSGAKLARDGTVIPTGVGRLCHWTHQGDSEADDFESFGAYQRTLELKCDQGEPGIIEWTPDADTPDTVYYQCFTHRYLGWKINVHDECDAQPAASELRPIIVKAPANFENADLEGSASIISETKVKPNDIIFNKSDKDLQSIKPNPAFFSKATAVKDLPKVEDVSEVKPIDKNQFTKFSYKRNVTEDALMMPPPPNQPNFYVQNKFSMRPLKHKNMPHPLRPVHNGPKKAPYRPIMKMPMLKRGPPNRFVLNKPVKTMNQFSLRSQGFLKKPLPMKVEISPPQISTEKEPVMTEKPYAPLISIKPQNDELKNMPMSLAVNTGFHPESVVIEGGFKPIINKEVSRSDDEPEIELESEIGMRDMPLNAEKIKKFGPVFIPSPIVDAKDKQFPKKRGVNVENEDDDDEETAAAERVESYYLPPADKKTKPVQNARKPSNIDIPPGTVVTYDGKKVSGASLTAKLADRSSIFEMRSSKAAEFIKARPQFAPFRGELPPLDPKFIDVNAPQLQSKGVINRDLDTPKFSTKLSLVRHLENSESDITDILKTRVRRSPHHTPEHTAEQLRNNSAKSSSSSIINKTCYITLIVFIVNFLLH